MVGGGNDAFIGAVHRIASRIDDRYELIAGALSSTAEKSQASGKAIGLPRIYDDFKSMAERESKLEDGIEAVSIVTPNHVHFAAASEFLKRGIHVVKVAEESDALFILTHNYTGYPMVRQAREMVANEVIGKVRVVQVEYPQDWLTTHQDFKQAEWRTDPKRSGAGGSTGDIGTHAFNLACFVSGLQAESLAADLQSFVPGRQVDDNAHVMLRFNGGARGMLWSSQVAPGNENALRLRVYGEKGGLEWAQEDPNYLWHTPFGQPYLEGFANLYTEAAEAIVAARSGGKPASEVLYPTVQDGLRGVQFVSACVKSSADNAAWTELEH